MSTSANTIRNLSAQLEESRTKLATATETINKLLEQNAEMQQRIRSQSITITQAANLLRGCP